MRECHFPMRVEDIDCFESLRDCWDVILERNTLENNNVFLTWEWVSTWWKYFGKGRKLLILVVKDNEEILAIAPLMLSAYKLLRFGNIRRIEFLGTPHSDYHNFIIIKKEKECLEKLLNYLTENIKDWNWMELKEIPGSASTISLLHALSSGSSFDLTITERACNLCPYIPIPKSFDILMRSLTKNMRQNLNKYLRRASKKYKIEFKKYDEIELSVNEAMEIFIRLHKKRWKAKGLPGAFEDKRFRDFHMEIAQIFDKKGWLGLYFLLLNGEPVSAQYTFEYNRKMYYYLAGFDPNFSNFSVGNLTIMFLLKECIKKGFKEYDMMRGDEAYKTMWTHKYRRNYEIRISRKDFYSRFFNWATSTDFLIKLAEKFRISLKLAPCLEAKTNTL